MINYYIVDGRRYYKLLDVEKSVQFTGIRYAIHKTNHVISMKSDKYKRDVFYVSEEGLDYLYNYLMEHDHKNDAIIIDRIKRTAVSAESSVCDQIQEEPAATVVDECAAEECSDTVVNSPIPVLSDLYRTFLYGDIPVRMIIRDNEPWFVAADICCVLEIKDTWSALSRLDEDEKDTDSISTLGGTQTMLIVNEPGLYSLVLSSRKPEARDFKRWITHDVIPNIRRSGGYISNTEQMLAHYFGHLDAPTKTVMRQAFETIEAMQKENSALKTTNKALSRSIQTWDNRAVVTALVRKFSSARFGGNFQLGWGRFYKELRYKKGIELAKRGSSDIPLIDKVKDEEWADLIEVASALCEEIDIDVAEIINEVNSERANV